MKIKFILIITILTLFIVGCNPNIEYHYLDGKIVNKDNSWYPVTKTYQYHIYVVDNNGIERKLYVNYIPTWNNINIGDKVSIIYTNSTAIEVKKIE